MKRIGRKIPRSPEQQRRFVYGVLTRLDKLETKARIKLPVARKRISKTFQAHWLSVVVASFVAIVMTTLTGAGGPESAEPIAVEDLETAVPVIGDCRLTNYEALLSLTMSCDDGLLFKIPFSNRNAGTADSNVSVLDASVIDSVVSVVFVIETTAGKQQCVIQETLAEPLLGTHAVCEPFMYDSNNVHEAELV